MNNPSNPSFSSPQKNGSKRGYLFLATGARKYHEMAINAALSAKWHEPHMPVCLIHDRAPVPDYAKDVFDDMVEMPPEEGFVGVMNKMLIYDLCPYDEAFFIDGDCFILRPDMARHWDKYSVRDFNIAGEAASSGSWYGFDIANACERAGVPFMVKGNTGVFYFKKGPEAQQVFEQAKDFVRHKSDVLGVVHQKRSQQFSDEPFLGAAMGKSGIQPVGYTPQEGTIMATTLYARGCKGDMETNLSVLKKPSSNLPTDRIWALSYVTHTPTIMHFISLKPRKLFAALSTQVRTKAGLPDFDFFA